MSFEAAYAAHLDPMVVCGMGCPVCGVTASLRRQSEFYATHDRTVPAGPDDVDEVDADFPGLPHTPLDDPP